MGLFSSANKSAGAKFQKLSEEGCLVTFSVEIPPTAIKDRMDSELIRVQQRAKLPGFRPGKAPLEVVRGQFAEHLRQEALDGLIRHYVPKALEELGLKPVAVPVVEEVSLPAGAPARLRVRVEVGPRFTPKDYLKIQVKRPSTAVTEQALAARLEELREAQARLERAEEEELSGDLSAVVDYQGFAKGKAMPNLKGEADLVDLSSDQTLEGLAAGLLGLKRGQTKDIPVKVSGQAVDLKVTIKEIKRKIRPELDESFAQDLNFGSVDELKAKLKEVMEAEGKTQEEREVIRQIESALLKANRIPLPPSLVEAQLEHMLKRLERQVLGGRGHWSEKQASDLREKLKTQAEDELRLSYILPAIAEKEQIKTLDTDLKSELEKTLEAAENPQKQQELRQTFEEKKESIAALIRDRKTMAFLKERAVITEGNG